MSVIKFIIKICAFAVGFFTIIHFANIKDKDKYILLNAENEEN